jgi:hypothetical protein
MIGPGKYDDVCTFARIAARADGAVLMVCNGRHGSGFSVQAPEDIIADLPRLLRLVADHIECDLRRNNFRPQESPG